MTDVNQLITDHLEIWTAATEKKSSAGRGNVSGVSLHGMKKLRELILELAVRGRLLPESTSKERGPTVPKAAKLKKTSHPDEKELGFVPQPNWTTAKFGEFFDLEYGDNLPKTKRSETGEVPVYGSNGVVGTHRHACVFSPCIVVGRKGSAGALNLCLNEACWVTDVAYSCVPPAGIDLHFAMVLFATLGLDNLGKGIKPGLNRNEAYALPVAIPPLAEQLRIVTKVNELMGLCDALEAQTEDSLKAHQTLVKICLATLTNSQSPEELSHSWTRIEANFHTLFTTEESIEELRSAIYLLATKGKLAAQHLTDQDGKVLLQNIENERAKALEGGYPNEKEAKTQLKKQSSQQLPKKLSELPQGWVWATLMQVSLLVIDCKNKTAPYASDGIRLIRTTNIRHGKLNDKEPKFVKNETYEAWSLRAKPQAGDLLITREAPMGEACLIPEGETICLGQRTMLARMVPETIDPNYILATFMSPDLMDRVQDKPLGMTVEHLRVGGVETLLIPIPPIEEQKRIVKRINNLNKLCDRLLAGLGNSKQLAQSLADTLTSKIH